MAHFGDPALHENEILFRLRIGMGIEDQLSPDSRDIERKIKDRAISLIEMDLPHFIYDATGFEVRARVIRYKRGSVILFFTLLFSGMSAVSGFLAGVKKFDENLGWLTSLIEKFISAELENVGAESVNVTVLSRPTLPGKETMVLHRVISLAVIVLIVLAAIGYGLSVSSSEKEKSIKEAVEQVKKDIVALRVEVARLGGRLDGGAKALPSEAGAQNKTTPTTPALQQPAAPQNANPGAATGTK
jgi:hypothetical protein